MENFILKKFPQVINEYYLDNNFSNNLQVITNAQTKWSL